MEDGTPTDATVAMPIVLRRGASPVVDAAPDHAYLVMLDQAWDAPVPPLPDAARGKHVLISAYVGLRGDVWHDGPLVHLAPDGRVASYVPRGGDATLTLTTLATTGTVAWDDLALDPLPDRAARCGTARMLASARGVSPALSFRLQHFDARAATLATLLRRAFPRRAITLAGPTAAALAPPAFRRFCQNAGVDLVAGDDDWPWLDELRGAAPPAHAAALVAALNARSDVMPRSLQSL